MIYHNRINLSSIRNHFMLPKMVFSTYSSYPEELEENGGGTADT